MSNKIRNARRVIRDAFAEDPYFRRSYQDNIAMAIYDHLRGFDLGNQNDRLDECNETADAIIKLIFESGFDDEDNNPTPTLEFLNSLVFEKIDVAQTMLDVEYPGCSIIYAYGKHIIYDTENAPCAAISHNGHIRMIPKEHVQNDGPASVDPKPVEDEKFEGYDNALKDLVE